MKIDVYNEIEPYAADWLTNLEAAGHIAPGRIDRRSIKELTAADVQDATQFHAFAGIAGWSYALRRAGWPDSRPVWSGSAPCQPWSIAGEGRKTDDPRHLWPEWFRLIRECRPLTLFGEQTASAAGLEWLDIVSADLESEGYAVAAADIPAAGVGAPHRRQRLYFMAYPVPSGLSVRQREELRGSRWRQERGAVEQRCGSPWAGAEWVECKDGKRRAVKSGIQPLADVSPGRVGKLCAYGNAIVAEVAVTFIRAAMEVLDEI